MIIRDSVWQQIRDQFTPQEKADLQHAFRGEVICPRGFVIQPADLPPPLLDKLDKLIQLAGNRGKL